MPTQTALVESRSWRVQCRRRLVIECELEEIVRATDEIGSARAAEFARAAERLRDLGWTIHADGSATCPVCLSVIDGTAELTVRGSIDPDPTIGQELLEDLVVPTGERYRDGRWVTEESVPVEDAIRSIAEIDQGEDADDE